MDSLNEFKYVSGPAPSLPKSTAYFCNVLNHVKLAILNVLPFEEASLPVKYLGMPLVSSRLKARDCRELIEKVRNRIGDWKNRFLSFAGRLQLINSVLSSLHVYWSSVFVLPASVIDEIEQLIRGFLWCQGEMKAGRAKVAWEKVCLPKEEGGLGIRRISEFNLALLTSHIWRLFDLKDSLWVRWIHTIKLRSRSFWDVPCIGNMTWSWQKILQARTIVRSHVWFIISNGLNVNVWHDNWCPLSPLSTLITPRMLSNAGFHSLTKLSEVIHNNQWTWPSAWNLQTPTPILYDHKPDSLVWKDRLGSLHPFSVGQVWNDIRVHGDLVGWAKLVWFSHSIPKHSFVLWLAIQRKLKTQDMLGLWDLNGVDVAAVKPPLCLMVPDSRDHLFFDCIYSSQVWHGVKLKIGFANSTIDWDTIVNTLMPLQGSRSVKSITSKLVCAATVYFIWRERNNRLFQNKRRKWEQIMDEILSTVRLKMLTFRFKKTRRVEEWLIAWDIPIP